MDDMGLRQGARWDGEETEDEEEEEADEEEVARLRREL
jgi:hypothetical protein